MDCASSSAYQDLSSRMTPLGRKRSFDHPVGVQQERRRDLDLERCRSLHVHHQLEFRRLLDGQVAGKRTLENLVNIFGKVAMQFAKIGTVTHKATGLNEGLLVEHGWKFVAGCERCESPGARYDARIAKGDQSTCLAFDSGAHGRLEIWPGSMNLNRQNCQTQGTCRFFSLAIPETRSFRIRVPEHCDSR